MFSTAYSPVLASYKLVASQQYPYLSVSNDDSDDSDDNDYSDIVRDIPESQAT